MQNKTLQILSLLLLATALTSATTDTVTIDDYYLEATYNSAIADETFTLTLAVTSDATTTKNITIDFDDDDPFDMITSENWNFEIASGETKTKSFRIEVDDDADAKDYDLEFNLDDQSDDWDEEFEIEVTTDKAEISLGEITSSPTKITPDTKEIELSIKIKNTGDTTAEDLIATLQLPNGFEASSSYSTQVHAGDLQTGDTYTLTFYFDADEQLTKDEYTAQLQLQYETDSDDETKTLDINLPVFSIPQFQITSIETLTDSIQPGSTSKIKISIQNIGGETGEEISLKAYERTDQPFTFTTKTQYIGTLNPSETGYAVFEFQTDPDAETIAQILTFQTRSVVSSEVIVDDLSTTIYITEKQTDLKSILIYSVAGLIILIIAMVVMLRRS